jgi:hypothetical protein
LPGQQQPENTLRTTLKTQRRQTLKRKIISIILALLLCVGLAVPALAVGTNVAPGGGGSSFEDIWSVSNVLSSNELGGAGYNGSHYGWTVYYTDAPTSGKLESFVDDDYDPPATFYGGMTGRSQKQKK